VRAGPIGDLRGRRRGRGRLRRDGPRRRSSGGGSGREEVGGEHRRGLGGSLVRRGSRGPRSFGRRTTRRLGRCRAHVGRILAPAIATRCERRCGARGAHGGFDRGPLRRRAARFDVGGEDDGGLVDLHGKRSHGNERGRDGDAGHAALRREELIHLGAAEGRGVAFVLGPREGSVLCCGSRLCCGSWWRRAFVRACRVDEGRQLGSGHFAGDRRQGWARARRTRIRGSHAASIGEPARKMGQ
jgi:hypothetical protein